MENDLYEALGVSKEATTDEIKKAYKKKAVQHHPDKEGGDKEKFQEVALAYNILSDESKREFYDATGNTSPLNIYNEFMGYINTISQAIVQDPNISVEYNDIVDIYKDLTRSNIDRATDESDREKAKMEKIKTMKDRTKYKKTGDDRIESMYTFQLKEIEKKVKMLSMKIDNLNKFIEILDNYEYVVDQKPTPTGSGISFRGWNTPPGNL